MSLRFFWGALGLVVCTTLMAHPADAQPAPGGDVPSVATPDPFAPNVLPSLNVPHTASRIVIDGDLTDDGWHAAAIARNFSETFPGDQTRPPVQVTTYLAYDDAHLYVAYHIEDDPAAVRANFSDRDQIWQDDYVGMLLDTNGDGQEVYFIASNPIGIQGDTRISHAGEDVSFDLIYYAAGQVTDDGYQVEMAIPFRSLRFPRKPVQQWRATFWITHPRDSRNTYSWAAIDRDDPCFSCQFGYLDGMTGVRSGGNLEIMPSITGAQAGQLRDTDDPASGFDNNRIHAEPSLALKYGITSDLTVDATLNPDFSQIEADAAQVDVNSTFALFFPERRPFFQEGSDLFQTPLQTVYTRSINDPVVASKLTGRFGATNVAYVGARDQTSPLLLPFEESSELVSAGRSLSNIVRVQHNFPGNSFLGALVTDRRLDDGGAGSTVGVDGVIRFLKKYQFQGQFVASHTAEIDDSRLSEDFAEDTFAGGAHTAALDGETFWGHALYGNLARNARHWSFNVDFQQYSPTFRADNGFITQNDSRRLMVFQNYTFYPERLPLVDRISPRLLAGRFWNYDGLQKDEFVQPRLFILLKRQTQINVSYLLSHERFRDLDFPGIRRLGLSLYSNLSETVQAGVEVQKGRSIARNLDTPELGASLDVTAYATIRPTPRLKLEPQFTYAENKNLVTDEAFFSGYIGRIRANYQFTRRFFMRTVVQYNDFAERLNVDPLLTYRVNPFTVFYVGSTHDYEMLPGLTDDTARYFQPTSRQFFFKFQYLFRT